MEIEDEGGGGERSSVVIGMIDSRVGGEMVCTSLSGPFDVQVRKSNLKEVKRRCSGRSEFAWWEVYHICNTQKCLYEMGTIYPNVKTLRLEVDLRDSRLEFKVYHICNTQKCLSEMGTIYPNVKTLRLEVDLRDSRLEFKFRIKDAPRHVLHYGLLFEGIAGLQSLLVKTARIIQQTKGSAPMSRLKLKS